MSNSHMFCLSNVWYANFCYHCDGLTYARDHGQRNWWTVSTTPARGRWVRMKLHQRKEGAQKLHVSLLVIHLSPMMVMTRYIANSRNLEALKKNGARQTKEGICTLSYEGNIYKLLRSHPFWYYHFCRHNTGKAGCFVATICGEWQNVLNNCCLNNEGIVY